MKRRLLAVFFAALMAVTLFGSSFAFAEEVEPQEETIAVLEMENTLEEKTLEKELPEISEEAAEEVAEETAAPEEVTEEVTEEPAEEPALELTEESEGPNPDPAAPVITSLAAPKFSSIKRVGNTIQLTWKAVANAERYVVYRKIKAGKTWKKIGETTDRVFADATMSKGLAYTYKICAVSGKVKSAYSNELDGIVLSQPKLVSAKADDYGIKVKWESVKGASGYLLFRKTGTGEWKYLKTLKGTYYKDKTCVHGKSYRYTVKALRKLPSRNFVSTYRTRGIGAKYSNPAMVLAKKKLDQIGWDLRTAYNWCTKRPYNFDQPTKLDSILQAKSTFGNGKGDCLGKACTFMYMARVLGYKARVVFGYVPQAGGTKAEHGWVEIYYKGAWRVCDASFEFGTGRNGWMLTYGQKGSWRYMDYKEFK